MGILGQVENDVVQSQEGDPTHIDQDQVGVKEVTNLGEAGGVPPGKEKTIVMDGPLSAIYTKALNLVYGKTEGDVVSTETQQMDAVLVADAHQFAIQKEEKVKDANEEDAAYVYVTDTNKLTENPTDSFDELRIALDMDTRATKAICIESVGVISSKAATILNYVSSHPSKTPVFYSRSSLIDFLQSKF